uniref:Zinc finger MYM-type protein 4-like n=1 Tax=Scleropages formosus TaxID=113540 RepID=A0A8C9VG38_SCLFO
RSNSITLPLKIKDEPMDEEYDCALAPQHLPEGIKDEPLDQPAKEQTAPPRTMTVNTSSVGSGSVVPAAPTAPPASSASVRVSCCGCKKVLLKGQTAYQRKGSSQLFCSTICLTSYNVPSIQSVLRKTCHSCWKEISNPKDVIIAPVDAAGTMKDFCSQSCLSEFDVKRKALSSAPAADGITIKCSMCQKTAAIRHEVNYQGVVHKLCSDGCFSRFRSNNKLTMNCCDNCGGYCYSGGGGGGGSQSNMLQIEGATKKFCSPACLSTYKQKSTRVSPCAMCFSLRSSAEMVESVTSQGMTELFCSTGCVTAYKVQSVRSSGKEVQCNQCKVTAVPQYHLAMSDGSMRSFCCYSCVIGFQTEFNKLATQAQMNVIPHGPSVPIVTAPQPTAPCTAAPDATAPKAPPLIVSLAPSARCPVRLTCRQCGRLFASKPELFAFKGEMIQFCGKTCAEEFKKANLIMARCEYCKIDKILKEVKMINHRECSFCSEGCKLLYKHDLTKRWGRHCQSCAYCSNTSQRVVQNHFAGKLEEFCGDSCMSHYTVLFYQMSRCDTCKRQGKLIESIQWLGDMKHFCNLQCLLQFCSQQTSVPVALAVPPSTVPTMPCPSSLASKEATPVIANVVSLSSAPVGQPSVCANTALQGTIPTTQAKVTGHASTQTDSLKLPPPTPRVLKNKALLCKPMNLNKGTICKPHTQSTHTQTEEELSRVLVLPVPIPVFIPVPLHLYTQHTQHTPVPVGVPVPVRLLHPCAHVSRTVHIADPDQGVKGKTAPDPEVDLRVADMPAEEGVETEKGVSQGGGQQDQDSRSIGGPESAAASTPSSWADEMASNGQHAGGTPSETVSLAELLDLEADHPIGACPVQPDPPPSETLQPVELKEDLLQCSPVELSYGLSLFVSGVRRPSGESYCADSLLYLCLGIQQYLCENGRSDNIFTDVLYSSFAEQITKILSDWTPAVLPGGYLHSRVQEEHLWQCKQLGTHSPAVLLNTLLLFTTKLLQLKTPGQHGRLSFAHISCGTRKLGNNSGRNVLRFCLPVQKRKDDKAVTLGKRRKEEEEGEVMEMPENTEDPLRCPVRLYKFYLSKCPDSVKQRTDMLYLQPEFPSVPDCPLWFSSQPLESSTLEAMLIRILAVREVHLDGEQAPPQATHADNEASD